MTVDSTDRDLACLPDPDNRAIAWFGGEPAFMAWWRHGETMGNGPAGALSFVSEQRLFERYAHAIPTNGALHAILAFGPIIEIGAGAGYWARLLRDLDGDVIATDPAPPSRNDWFRGSKPWTAVERAGVEMIPRCLGRAVLVCWPSRPNGFMNDVMTAARDRAIALVTNGLRRETDDLIERLNEGWSQLGEVLLPTTPIPYRGDSLTLWTPL